MRPIQPLKFTEPLNRMLGKTHQCRGMNPHLADNSVWIERHIIGMYIAVIGNYLKLTGQACMRGPDLCNENRYVGQRPSLSI